MRGFQSILWLMAVFVLGCGGDSPIHHLEGAKKFTRWDEGGGVRTVEYELKALYPAEAQLAELDTHYAELGWKPMAEPLWAGAGDPQTNPSGWQILVADLVNQEARGHVWNCDYEGPDGDAVRYELLYSQRGGKDEPQDRLIVTAQYYPARMAEGIRRQIAESVLMSEEALAGEGAGEGLLDMERIDPAELEAMDELQMELLDQGDYADEATTMTQELEVEPHTLQ